MSSSDHPDSTNPLINNPELAAGASAPSPASSAPRSTHNPAASTSSAGLASESALERVLTEVLRDRRAQRRWNGFFRLAWLGVVLLMIWTFSPHHGLSNVPTGPHTALVEVRGEIGADTEANAEVLISALRDAFESPTSQAVVLRINSPGGSPVQSGMVNDEIRRLKDLHKKKIYAVVEEMCASGAYYVAAAADEIYVDKASVVGSIGVLMDGFGFSGLMDKLGIERRLITAGDNKGMLDPFSRQSEREVAYAQAMIDQIHRQFIAAVKQGRGSRLKESGETFSGLFWNGEEAVRLGLADDMGTVDSVAREVIKAPDVVDYTPRENVAERLAKRFGASVGQGAVKALRELAVLR